MPTPFETVCADFELLNSATKYPSIPTHHPIGRRGRLEPDPAPESAGAPEGDWTLTEKVDGTNARIVFFRDGDYLIGGRNEFLTARGDRIPNPANRIVEAARPFADAMRADAERTGRTLDDAIAVFYGEVYGAGVGKAGKQYAGEGEVGFRLFDVMFFGPTVVEGRGTTPLPDDPTPAKVAAWRDAGGGQLFVPYAELSDVAEIDAETVMPCVPELRRVAELPKTHEECLALLEELLPETRVGFGGVAGRAEGLVARNDADGRRQFCCKLRFADYRRALAGVRA